MRRIAKEYCLVSTALFTVALIFATFVPARAASKKQTVIVKVNDASQVNQISKKYNWKVQLKVQVGAGAMFVIEDVSVGQAKQLLKNEPSVVFVEQNSVIP